MFLYSEIVPRSMKFLETAPDLLIMAVYIKFTSWLSAFSFLILDPPNFGPWVGKDHSKASFMAVHVMVGGSELSYKNTEKYLLSSLSVKLSTTQTE